MPVKPYKELRNAASGKGAAAVCGPELNLSGYHIPVPAGQAGITVAIVYQAGTETQCAWQN